jgi:hypothetical protein
MANWLLATTLSESRRIDQLSPNCDQFSKVDLLGSSKQTQLERERRAAYRFTVRV